MGAFTYIYILVYLYHCGHQLMAEAPRLEG